jgi:Regulator of ribonuclease activity B
MSFVAFLERMMRGKPPSDPAQVDQIVIRQLRSLGADLSLPRHVRHFLYFEAQSSAQQAAEEIERADYSATVSPPSAEIPVWTVVAEGFRVIGPDTVAGFRAWFEHVATEHHGEYDGWEPARSP